MARKKKPKTIEQLVSEFLDTLDMMWNSETPGWEGIEEGLPLPRPYNLIEPDGSPLQELMLIQKHGRTPDEEVQQGYWDLYIHEFADKYPKLGDYLRVFGSLDSSDKMMIDALINEFGLRYPMIYDGENQTPISQKAVLTIAKVIATFLVLVLKDIESSSEVDDEESEGDEPPSDIDYGF